MNTPIREHTAKTPQTGRTTEGSGFGLSLESTSCFKSANDAQHVIMRDPRAFLGGWVRRGDLG